MRRVTRRTMLTLTAVGTGTLVMSGGTAFVLTSETGLVRRTLEYHLGPVPIDDGQLRDFVADYTKGKSWLLPGIKLAKGYELALASGSREIGLKMLSSEDRARIQTFERRLLGAFFVKTNFAFRNDAADAVVYMGNAACLNPFASF